MQAHHTPYIMHWKASVYFIEGWVMPLLWHHWAPLWAPLAVVPYPKHHQISWIKSRRLPIKSGIHFKAFRRHVNEFKHFGWRASKQNTGRSTMSLTKPLSCWPKSYFLHPFLDNPFNKFNCSINSQTPHTPSIMHLWASEYFIEVVWCPYHHLWRLHGLEPALNITRSLALNQEAVQTLQ